MAAGGTFVGLAYFAAVKFAGYTAAASFIKRRIPSSTSPWLIGGVRTVIGLAAGIGAAYLAFQLGILRTEIAFYALLAPIRIGEWLLLLALFFRQSEWNWQRSLNWAGLGTLWSYALDIPAIFAVFAIPGGAWIC